MNRINIVYENADIWVLNKPAGLAAQGGAGIRESAETLISACFEQKAYLVHRLDKETAGLLLVAKHAKAAARYSRFFKEGLVEKRYKAVAAGNAPKLWSVDTPITRKGSTKNAKTVAQRLGLYGDFSLLDIRIYTGRMHQIRIHLQQSGWPIVGDSKYGDFKLNRRLKKEANLSYMLLFAESINLPQANLYVKAPLPDYFQNFLNRWRTGAKKPYGCPHA